MKYLLTITLYLFFSTSHADSSLVDPDSIDPSMPVVSYLVPESNLEITAYHLDSPSKLKVKLCRTCLEKTYLLDPKAELKLLGEPLDKAILTETLLKKEFPLLRLIVNRSKGMIIYLDIGVNRGDEFWPTSTSNNKHRTLGVIN